MGFLSNIFKKKPGGTMFGNILRGGASYVSGGLLGSGAGLQKWEQEQAEKANEAYYKSISENNGFQAGANLVKGVALPLSSSGQPNPTIGQNILSESLKKNWYFIAGGVLALIGLMYFIMKPKKNKFK